MIDRNCQWRVVFLWSAHHEILYHVHHGKTRFPQVYLGFARSTRARPGLFPIAGPNSDRSVRPSGSETPFAGMVGTLLIIRGCCPADAIRIFSGDILVTHSPAFATDSPIDRPELVFLGRKEHSASPSPGDAEQGGRGPAQIGTMSGAVSHLMAPVGKTWI